MRIECKNLETTIIIDGPVRSGGKSIIRDYFHVELWEKESKIYEDNDFSPSPLHGWDSLWTIVEIGSFLTYGGEDIWGDYPKVLEWQRTQACEELEVKLMMLEEELEQGDVDPKHFDLLELTVS